MSIKQLLLKYQNQFTEVIEGIRTKPSIILDLTKSNPDLVNLSTQDPAEFEEYRMDLLQRNQGSFTIGKYNEDRTIYDHSKLFGGTERRTVHLGIDLGVAENTPVFAPFKGRVHSFRFNDAIGDYGPTIVLEHLLDGSVFYTLYGHLTLESLEHLAINQEIRQGEMFCKVGGYPVNGNWPPHLHFQVIADMGNYNGDFPGVCKKSEREKYLEICPDPNFILQIPSFGKLNINQRQNPIKVSDILYDRDASLGFLPRPSRKQHLLGRY